MMRLLIMVCLLILSSAVSPQSGSALPAEVNPSLIVRQEWKLDPKTMSPDCERSRIPMIENGAAGSALGVLQQVNPGESLGNPDIGVRESDARTPMPEMRWDLLFANPDLSILHAKDIVVPMKPGSRRSVRK